MAHFARINSDNIVIAVHTLSNRVLMKDGEENEQQGAEFLQNLHKTTDRFIQTSYNANFRKNYAGKGNTYDKDQDAFIPPQPFPSWTWNIEQGYWEAPVECPEITKTTLQRWNEETISWDEVVIEQILLY